MARKDMSMRNLLCFLLVLAQCTFSLAALPPTTIKGQSDSNKSTTFNFEVPFHQATKTSATTGLIETGNTNMLKNPGFEAGLVSWTASGGILAEATGSNIGYSRGATWDANNADQTLCSDAVAIPEMFKGQNGELSVRVKVPSGTATHELYVTDGANVLASSTIISSDSFAPVSLSFVFPDSGNVQACLKSVAADEPLIALDDWYLGPNRNIGTVAQATFVGAALFEGYADFSTNSTSAVDVVHATAFGAATRKLVGLAQPHDTPDIFGAKFNVTPGRYIAKFHAGAFMCSSSPGSEVANHCFFIVRVSGTATITEKSGGMLRLDANRVNEHAHVNNQNEITFEFTVTSPGTVSLRLAAFVNNSSGRAYTTSAHPVETTPHSLTLYRYPTESEQVMRLGQGADLLGTIIYTEQATCPAGTLHANGGTIPPEYSALIARRGSNTLPDLRGIFIRGAGAQTISGVVYSATLGQKQGQSLSSHKHILPFGWDHNTQYYLMTAADNPVPGYGSTVQSVLKYMSGYNPSPIETGPTRLATTDGDLQNVTGETRPANIALTPCIIATHTYQPLVKQAVIYDDKVRAEGKSGVTSIDYRLNVPLTTSDTTNIASITIFPDSFRYFRIGNQVEVTAFLSVDPTNEGLPFSFRTTIPVPSDFTVPADAVGVCVALDNVGAIQVRASPSDDKFEFRGTQSNTNNINYTCKINYVVK